MASFSGVCSFTSLEHRNALQLASFPSFRRAGLASHVTHAALAPRRVSLRAFGSREAEFHFGWPIDDGLFSDDAVFDDEQPRQLSADLATNRAFPRILGLGQAMNDVSCTATDEMLIELGVEKGSRKIITVEERADLLERLEGREYHVSAGGSLSNSLMALARLAASKPDSLPLSVAMAGLVGNDPLGEYYIAQMRSTGVDVIAEPLSGAATGTVVVLTSPDAQRTMLSYLGTSAAIDINPRIEAAIAESSVICIEGYLWELPEARTTIRAAIAAARKHGTAIAMTAGDVGVVERHHEEMWEVLGSGGLDILFANAIEAASLVAHAPQGAIEGVHTAATPAETCALALGSHCSLACVTDGSAGSAVAALGELHVIPPHWTTAPPVDSCGAGDAYAAGFLYGYVKGYDVTNMGRAAARTASAVIAHYGALLGEDAAAAVTAALPAGAESGQVNADAASTPTKL